MRLHFLLFPPLGVGLGLLSLLVLPRWEPFDTLYTGLGLVVPVLLLFAAVTALAVAVDNAPPARRAGKVALMLVSEVATFAVVLANLRIGW